ncbi:MAG: hypothetical protein OXP07_00605 [Defluviicoccus sp.]|nr:hypothetical protein [Defluviicoccus sp.]
MERAIWLSYDLGTSGDYEGMYAWLESHGAQECGSSVAFLKSYGSEGNFLESLQADVGDAVTLNRRSRIHVLYKDDGRLRGSLLFGKRKAPP